jgi:hypothetical protein
MINKETNIYQKNTNENECVRSRRREQDGSFATVTVTVNVASDANHDNTQPQSHFHFGVVCVFFFLNYLFIMSQTSMLAATLAYILAEGAGHVSPDASAIRAVLKVCGLTVADKTIRSAIDKMSGRSIQSVAQQGQKQIQKTLKRRQRKRSKK